VIGIAGALSGTGALGHVDGDGVHFYRAPLKAHMPDTEFAVRAIGVMPRVDIVLSYAGADTALVDAVTGQPLAWAAAPARTLRPMPRPRVMPLSKNL